MAARMAIIAITIRSSIRVNDLRGKRTTESSAQGGISVEELEHELENDMRNLLGEAVKQDSPVERGTGHCCGTVFHVALLTVLL